MAAKTVLSLLGIALVLLCGSELVAAQAGCALLDKKQPAQSLSFERIEDVADAPANRHAKNVVLRFRNNSNCDVTLLSYDPDPRAMELVKTPEGKRIVRIAGPENYPDGARLEIKYHIDYQQPLPPPKKRIFVDETVTEFRLRSGRSILFTVPLTQFDLWVSIEVPFRFDWDSTLYHPSHYAFFGNMDLPEEIFRKTKVCSKVDWCKP